MAHVSETVGEAADSRKRLVAALVAAQNRLSVADPERCGRVAEVVRGIPADQGISPPDTAGASDAV